MVELTKRCPQCGIMKPYTEFSKDCFKKDNLQTSCKQRYNNPPRSYHRNIHYLQEAGIGFHTPKPAPGIRGLK